MAHIALGVTGGIGAYKAVEVVRGLQRAGHDVTAIMTRSARRFVGPLTFEAITRRRVITDQFAPGTNADIEHIALASSIAALVVAPATANILAKFARGLADDFLSCLYLATTAPVVVAPAMNTHMWEHPAVRENLATLVGRGVRVVEPGEGYLACGWIGKGRLAEPETIVQAVLDVMRPAEGGTLAGTTVLVTAGPTYEDLDPVRFLGNRSSGRMGLAVAAEAARRGARVVLVLGPTPLGPPAGVEVVRVRGAAEMRAAVMERLGEADVLVMAAAVADYTPRGGLRPEKIAREDAPLTLALEPTPDILGEASRARGDRDRPVLVGFAAEVGDPVARAQEKLARKRIDLVVANDISRPDSGFEVDTNEATLVSSEHVEKLPLMPKARLAAVVLDRVEAMLAARRPAAAREAGRAPSV